MRTPRAAFEENLNEHIDTTHPIVPWLIGYAGELTTRFRMRRDGRAAFRKLKGYDPIKPIVEFGESIYIKPPEDRPGRQSLQTDGPKVFGSQQS